MITNDAAQTCRLCLKPSELRDSHIVPEFLYRELYNEKRQMMGINGKGSQGWKALQKGMREKLFCDDCEQLLNDQYEKPFLNYWRDKYPLPETLKPEQVICIEVPDYAKFKLFHLSVFFRAGISTLPTFRDAELTEKHESRLREMILNQDPGKDWEYMLFGYILIHHVSQKPVPMVSQPFQRRLDGNRCLGMIYGHVEWCMTQISHEARSLRGAGLTPDGLMPLMAIPWNEHEVLKAANRMLNTQV